MNKYLIINGDKAYIIERDTLEQANTFAVRFMNHSKEIIVRQISSLTDYSIVYENQA